jgi:hypothetical protein
LSERAHFFRSVSDIPPLLFLESIDSEKKFSPSQLSLLVAHCPYAKSVRMRYLPTEEEEEGHMRQQQLDINRADDDEDGDSSIVSHLAMLAQMDALKNVSLAAADFYGHFVFRHVVIFLRCSAAIFYADRRNYSSRCLLRCLPRPQDAMTPSNSTRHTSHLGL